MRRNAILHEYKVVEIIVQEIEALPYKTNKIANFLFVKRHNNKMSLIKT
jgi:hypothetical protein